MWFQSYVLYFVPIHHMKAIWLLAATLIIITYCYAYIYICLLPTKILIPSIPVLVFCVVQLILVTRVCSLCMFLIINKLLLVQTTTITDDNGKVDPYQDHCWLYWPFSLLLLKFVIWSLQGLVAGELYHSTVNPVVVLDLCFSRCSCWQCSYRSTVHAPVVW